MGKCNAIFMNSVKGNLLSRSRLSGMALMFLLIWHCTKNEVIREWYLEKKNKIQNFLRMCSHLLKKFLTENFILRLSFLNCYQAANVTFYDTIHVWWKKCLNSFISEIDVPELIKSRIFYLLIKQRFYMKGLIWRCWKYAKK